MEILGVSECCEQPVLGIQNDQIELLRRQYLQVVDPKQLTFPSGSFLKGPAVQSEIFTSFFEGKRVPPDSYQCKVLKKLITLIQDAIEDPNEDEVSDQLYTLLTLLISSNSASVASGSGVGDVMVPKETKVLFSPPVALDGPPRCSLVSSEIINSFSVSGGTGHRTWEASLHLGHYLCADMGKALIRDKAVLELGAGRGLVSYLCLNQLEARRVYPTDGDRSCVMRFSRLPGGAAERWIPCLLQWDRYLLNVVPFLGLPAEAQGEVDTILGADITFDTRIMPDLVRTLHRLLHYNRRARAFISATIRNEETIRAFHRACESESMGVKEVAFDCPESVAEQTGLFHSHDIPIRIYEVIPLFSR